MTRRQIFASLPTLALFVALAPGASADNRWYVNGVTGNDNNDCESSQTACKTIGRAISLASPPWSVASGDSVMVAPATYTENLTIDFSLKVIGSAASTTIIDGGGVNTVVTISSPTAHVTLSQLTVRNGWNACCGAGINNSGTLTITQSKVSGNTAFCLAHDCTAFGGGIYDSGTLNISRSTVSSNSVGCQTICEFSGGGIYNVGALAVSNSTVSGNQALVGGGIDNERGMLTISKTTVSGNVAGYGGGISNGATLLINNSTIGSNRTDCFQYYCSTAGGGISNAGTLEINNSTISGNDGNGNFGGFGGGISNSGTLSINNGTVSGNSADDGGGGIDDESGSTKLQNSIVASSLSGGNCAGSVISKGYNLSSDSTCNFNNTGDLNNTNSLLGPLQNNGGPTQTMVLPGTSPAIDAGNPNGCTDGQGNLLKTDQRGAARPGPHDHHGCDMGAFENQQY